MMYDDQYGAPTIPPLQYHFHPHCDYFDSYRKTQHKTHINDVYSSDEDASTQAPPRIPKPRKTSPYYMTSTSFSSILTSTYITQNTSCNQNYLHNLIPHPTLPPNKAHKTAHDPFWTMLLTTTTIPT